MPHLGITFPPRGARLEPMDHQTSLTRRKALAGDLADIAAKAESL